MRLQAVERTDLQLRHSQEKKDQQQAHQDQLQALHDEATADGIELTKPVQAGMSEEAWKGDAKGRLEAINKAKAENENMLERALMTLERQRLTAQRQVLVSGVSQEATVILNDLPKASDLMVTAQHQQQQISAHQAGREEDVSG